MVLAYAAAHLQKLVVEGRVLHNKLGAIKPVLVENHSKDEKWDLMFLQEIIDLAGEQVWGGGLTAILTSDALGIAVKLIHPKDLVSHKH